MSAGWRQGASTVPTELHHRPRWFIQHMMSTELKSQDITSDMMIADSQDSFRVQSSKTDKWYNVSIGDDNTFPFCTCRQFMKYFVPCKHFCAVFRHEPNVSFSSLSQRYRDHPLFVVDDECVSSQHSIATADTTLTEGDVPDATVSSEIRDEQATDDGVSASTRQTLARDCRELASVIVNYTYDVVSVDVLQHVKDILSEAAERLGAAYPASGGIPLHAASGVQAAQTKDKSSSLGKRRKSTKPATRADTKRTRTIDEFFGDFQTTQSAAVPTEVSSTGVVGQNLEASGSCTSLLMTCCYSQLAHYRSLLPSVCLSVRPSIDLSVTCGSVTNVEVRIMQVLVHRTLGSFH